MSQLDTAMILAAGRGERMRPLTDSCPKPLLSVAGKPLIVWHLEKLRKAGFKRVVINHAYLGEQIEQTLGNGETWGLTIYYSAEQQALETAGGIVKALPLLDRERFAVINGDVWFELDYALLRRFSGEQLAHLLLVDNPEHNPQGDFALAKGLVKPTKQYTFSGFGIYQRRLFADLPTGRCALAPILRQAMSAGRVSGQHVSQFWMDVGTPQRLAQLTQRIEQQQAEQELGNSI